MTGEVAGDGLQLTSTVPYFAYGSNLDMAQMRDRCRDYAAKPAPAIQAKATGWRLHFPRFAKSRKGGVASIEPADAGQVVWGVVYELTPKDWERLSKHEGIQPGRDLSLNAYRWEQLTVTAVGSENSAREMRVGTFIANAVQERLPAPDYLEVIIGGARQHRLPDDYISRLIALREAVDRKPDDLDVAVIGGGISGLYCAYMLRYNQRVRLFEATDRLGGRIWSTRFLDGKRTSYAFNRFRDLKQLDFCAEFGPMRIELEQQELLAELLSELKITEANGDFEPFPPYGSPSSPHDPKYELRGEETEQQTPMDLLLLAFMRILGRLSVATPDHKYWPDDGIGEEAYDFAACLKQALDAMSRAAATRQPDWKRVFLAWINKLDEPDYQSLRKYGVFDDGTAIGTPLYVMGFWNLLTDVLSHHAVMKIRDFGTFYHLINENPNAAEWLIFWLRGLKTSQTMKGIVGGMQRIPEELERRIPSECVSRSRRLVGITADGNDPKRVLLQFDVNGGRDRETVSARHVILALPKAPLEELALTNSEAFTDQIRDDMDSVFGFPMVKLFLIVEERWWPENTASLTNRYATVLPTRELHFINCRRKDDDSGMVLIYTDRPASAFLANYVLRKGAQDKPEWGTPTSNGRLIKKAVQYLEESGGQNLAENNFRFYGIRDWGRKPYSGANHAWRPERKSWEALRRLSEFALRFRAQGGGSGTAPIVPPNVHVCGEAYSDYHGFIEGALRSAKHVLHTIDKEAFATKTPWLCSAAQCSHSLTRPLGQKRPCGSTTGSGRVEALGGSRRRSRRLDSASS